MHCRGNALQHTATHYNKLQYTATLCNTLYCNKLSACALEIVRHCVVVLCTASVLRGVSAHYSGWSIYFWGYHRLIPRAHWSWESEKRLYISVRSLVFSVTTSGGCAAGHHRLCYSVLGTRGPAWINFKWNCDWAINSKKETLRRKEQTSVVCCRMSG